MYRDFMIYAGIYRFSIVLAGTVCIILGYKLFSRVQPQEHHKKGPHKNNDADDSELKIMSGNHALRFRSSSPGLVFSLFGILLITAMVILGAPSLQYETVSEYDKNGAVVELKKIIRLRNEQSDSIQTILTNYDQEFYDAETALDEIRETISSAEE